MYEGLNHDICKTAWEVTLGSVLSASRKHVTNKVAGTIVVCVRRYDDEVMNPVFMANVDDENPNCAKYENIAAEKAQVSWETGLSSRKVQQDAPFLYQNVGWLRHRERTGGRVQRRTGGLR